KVREVVGGHSTGAHSQKTECNDAARAREYSPGALLYNSFRLHAFVSSRLRAFAPTIKPYAGRRGGRPPVGGLRGPERSRAVGRSRVWPRSARAMTRLRRMVTPLSAWAIRSTSAEGTSISEKESLSSIRP